jgi:tetratricopeptide (TPR) repeat protein
MKTWHFQALEKNRTTIVLVVAFTALLALKPGFPLEGPWLNDVATMAGADPSVPRGSPIWFALVWLFTKLPVPWDISIALLGCLASASCIALLFEFLMRFRFRHARDATVDFRARWTSAILGSLAALFCTRLSQTVAAFSPHPVGLALFLASLVISAGWRDDPRRWRFYLSAFLSGLSLAECPPLVWLVPLHAFVWLIRFLRAHARQIPEPRPSSVKKGALYDGSLTRTAMGLFALNVVAIIAACACLLAGFIPAALQMLLYASVENTLTAGPVDLVTVVAIFVVEALNETVSVLPKYGWVYVLALGLFPGFVIFSQRLERKPPLNRPGTTKQNREIMLWQWVRFAFRATVLALVFGGIAVLQLAKHRFSSFDLLSLDAGPGLMFFIAAWIGRWAGSLHVIAKQEIEPALLPPFFHRLFSPELAAVAAAAVCLCSPFLRGLPNDASAARWRFAKQIAASLDGRRWLVTEGGMDSLTLAAANRAKKPLTNINMNRAGDPVYRNFIARQLTDPTLRIQCEKNLRGMLTAWAVKDAAAASASLAILRDGAYWQSSGNSYVPAGVIYLGATPSNEPAVEAVWRANVGTWNELNPPAGSRLAAHAAKVANDCGVWMLRHGRTNLALQAFSQSLAFDTNNISARLNLLSAGGEKRDDRLPAISTLIDDPVIAPQLKSLRVTLGFLAEPQRWTSNGWAWATAGSLDPAHVELTARGQRVFDLLTEGRKAMGDGNNELARASFEKALAEGGTLLAMEELLGLDLLTEDLGQISQHAGEILKTMPDHFLANYGMGYVYFMSNKLDLAESALRASIASKPMSCSWAELSRVLWAKNLPDEAMQTAEQAIAMNTNQANAWRIKGLVLAKRGDFASAKQSLETALARNPDDRDAKDALSSLPR